MSTSLRTLALIWCLPIVLGTAVGADLGWPDSTAAVEKAAPGQAQKWAKVSVALPTNDIAFPPGNGADIANGQCQICHSADMVLRQPPLTQDEWSGEINKMRNSFGAPLPADQVDALARYLQAVNGRQGSPKSASAVDGRGS